MSDEILLKEGERLDDLQRMGLHIIQAPGEFCFGMDAVLLTGFAAEHVSGSGFRLMDLCTGSGIIPILLSAKTEAARLSGMEIQPRVADMAKRSVSLNSLDEKIEIINDDIKKAAEYFNAASFDVVTVNPPYFKKGHGLVNPEDSKSICRHEISCTLKDVLECASYLLREGGAFYMVHRPHRMAEIIEEMRRAGIEPKTLKCVHARADADATMILLEGRKGGGAEMCVERPLIIYGEDGEYTEEMGRIYGY